jgi:hypothetical protein
VGQDPPDPKKSVEVRGREGLGSSLGSLIKALLPFVRALLF